MDATCTQGGNSLSSNTCADSHQKDEALVEHKVYWLDVAICRSYLKYLEKRARRLGFYFSEVTVKVFISSIAVAQWYGLLISHHK